jgi:acyl-CoA synthetase (AMP-forming)/AMP-acid ligase II/acyl carrier protein
LLYRAARSAERRAYTFLRDGESVEASLTYGELDRRARAVAARLVANGAAHRPVLLLYPPGIDYIVGFYACLYAGALAVPAYPPRPNRSADRLASIVRDANPALALTTSRLLERTQSRLHETVPELRCLATDDVADEDFTPAGISPDAIAFLQYTSGSTSEPKGVVISHGNLMHNIVLMERSFGLTERDSVVSWLPPYHDMGLIGNLLFPLYGGSPVTLMAPAAFLQRPLRWLETISRERGTSTAAPNFAYDLCVRLITPEQRATLDLSSWRLAVCGSEPVRAETLQRFTDTFAPCGFRAEAFAPSYGLAEATLLVTGHRPVTPPAIASFDVRALEENRVAPAQQAGFDRALVGCGGPPPGVRIAIVDPESKHPCAPDRIGEIWTASSSVGQGYHHRDSAKTFAARLDGDGSAYLRTGDLGFVHDGALFVTGRIKELIVLRGRNIYPQDLERTAQSAHASLSMGSGAAFAVAGDGEERLVVVHEVQRHCGPADTELMLRGIRSALAERHDVDPLAIVLVKPLGVPKTSSGKIQRQVCREMYLRGELPVVAQWSAPAAKPVAVPAPFEQRLLRNGHKLGRDAIRRRLRARIAVLLELEPSEIDMNQPLVEHGIDSMKAVTFSLELETWLDRKLPPTLLWDYPTIDALAEYVAGEVGAVPVTLPTLSDDVQLDVTEHARVS